MEYRQLGTSNLKVSVVGLGTNNFGGRLADPAASARVVHAALDVGVNFIDTSINYGNGESEAHIGKALKGRRADALVATKFNLTNLEGKSVRERIFEHCETSLARLEMDYVDLFQIHWPGQDVSQEEILEPLTELVKQGKVREIGETNYSGWRHAQADAISRERGFARMVSSQNHYNLLRRQVELELLLYCNEAKVGFLPYFPLASGYLTGKYKPGQPAPEGSRGAAGGMVARYRNERNDEIVAQLTQFAESRSHTLLELAFAWLLAAPCVSSVIAGAMTPEQIQANAKAGEWKLTDEESAAVDEISAWDGTGNVVEAFGGGNPNTARPKAPAPAGR